MTWIFIVCASVFLLALAVIGLVFAWQAFENTYFGRYFLRKWGIMEEAKPIFVPCIGDNNVSYVIGDVSEDDEEEENNEMSED